jgi:hypothetical protein
MQNPIGKPLRDLDVGPLLTDVGASGEPPAIWSDRAPHGICVGFDPGSREIHEDRVALATAHWLEPDLFEGPVRASVRATTIVARHRYVVRRMSRPLTRRPDRSWRDSWGRTS